MPPSDGRPDHVRVVNEGDEPFENWLNGQRVVLAPGEARVMNWDHAGGWLGDPTIFNSGRHRARTQEYMRLRVMYGVYEREDEEHRLPRLAVYWPVEAPIDEQQRINMILDDPEGLAPPTWGAAAPASADDRIAALERELAAMRRTQSRAPRRAKSEGGSAADGGAGSPRTVDGDNTAGLDDLEPDGPGRVAVS